MRRAMLAVAGMACIGAACSSDAANTQAPTISAEVTEQTASTAPAPEDTRPQSDAPTTTISADVDEQSAAFAAHWSFVNFDRCLSYTQVSGDSSEDDSARQFCTEDDFSATDSGESLASLADRFAQYKEEGIRSAANPLPSEHAILWSRKSASNNDVIGVLECQRNYYVTVDQQGEVLDDSSQTALALLRVVRGEDRQWRVDSSIGIDIFQSPTDGDDSCSTFEGTEVEDTVFDEFIR